MREKLETLPLTQLRELARGQGIKNVSGLRKSELVDRLCEVAERENAAEAEKAENAAGTEKAEERLTKKEEKLKEQKKQNRQADRQGRKKVSVRKERSGPSRQTGRKEETYRLRMVLCLRQATPEMICRTWTAGLKPMEFWRLCQTDLDSYGVRIFFREKTMSMWPRLRFDGSI